MDLSKGDAARERHRGGYEKWEGGEEEVEEGGGGMVTKRETDLERDGGRRSEGRARETGRGRVKERKRLDRISSLRVTMGGSIEKII